MDNNALVLDILQTTEIAIDLHKAVQAIHQHKKVLQ